MNHLRLTVHVLHHVAVAHVSAVVVVVVVAVVGVVVVILMKNCTIGIVLIFFLWKTRVRLFALFKTSNDVFTYSKGIICILSLRTGV